MYIVIEKFKDRDGKVYEVNDEYKGDRINALSTKRNRLKRVFIKEVKEGD